MTHDLVTKRTPLHAAGIGWKRGLLFSLSSFSPISPSKAGNGYVECVQIMLRYLTNISQVDVVDNQGR